VCRSSRALSIAICCPQPSLTMTGTISKGTLNLRFMQNARRAEQKLEVESVGTIATNDDSYWEVSREVKGMWGITSEPSSRYGVPPIESKISCFFFLTYIQLTRDARGVVHSFCFIWCGCFGIASATCQASRSENMEQTRSGGHRRSRSAPMTLSVKDVHLTHRDPFLADSPG
jgi:hypothetical protein